MAKRNSTGLPIPAAPSAGIAKDPPAQTSVPDSGLRIYTGDIEAALTFAKSTEVKHTVLIEVFAQVLNNKSGDIRGQRLILLRNGNKGPAMQSVYYETSHPLPNIEVGDMVRCVGQFIGATHRFRIEKLNILDDPAQYEAVIDRLLAISNHTAKK